MYRIRVGSSVEALAKRTLAQLRVLVDRGHSVYYIRESSGLRYRLNPRISLNFLGGAAEEIRGYRVYYQIWYIIYSEF